MQKGTGCQIGVKMVRDEHPLVGPPEAMGRGVRFVMGWYAAQEGRLKFVTDNEQVLEATDHIDLPR
jgi:hypothetical protein